MIEKEDRQLPLLVAKQDYVYQLVASVRLSGERYDKKGMKIVDDVRTYWIDGQPVDSRNVAVAGNKKEEHMEKEYKEAGNKRWSIREPGRYLLFYTRVTLADGVPESVLEKKFPESSQCLKGKKHKRKRRLSPRRRIKSDTNTRLPGYIVPDLEFDEESEFPIRRGGNPSKPVMNPQEKPSGSRESAERAVGK